MVWRRCATRAARPLVQQRQTCSASPHRSPRCSWVVLLPPPLVLLLLLAASPWLPMGGWALRQLRDAAPASGRLMLAAPFPDVPWCHKCTVPSPAPLFWQNCSHHWQLDQGVQDKGWNLISFPDVPESDPELWPHRPGDQEVLQQCKYIAFETGLLDGLGSQYHRVMRLVAWAVEHNVSYVDLPLVAMEHETDPGEAFRLLNLGDGFTPLREIPSNATICMAEYCGPRRPATDTLRPHMLEKIHIRRGDVGDMSPKNSRWVPDSYFVSAMRNISADLAMLWDGRDGYEFHIFSEGALETTFANMSAAVADLPVVWRLNGNPMRAFRGLMCADVLVMSPSNFDIVVADWFTARSAIVVEPWQGWCTECGHRALTRRKLPLTLYGLQQRADGRTYLSGC